MSSTTINLLIPLVATSQNMKEITANSAFDALDEALCANKSISMTDADYTVAQADALENIFLKFTGALTVNRNVIFPSGAAKLYIVYNGNSSLSGVSLIFKCGTGAVVAVIAPGAAHLLYCDGVNSVYQVS